MIHKYEIVTMLIKQSINTLNADDNTALQMSQYYPEWESLCDSGFVAEKAGYIFQHKGTLYRTVKDSTSFERQWVPGIGTESIYRPISPEHTGDMDDPIPWVSGMDCVEGKYYSYGGKTYRVAEGGTMKPCVWPPDTPDMWQWEVVE